MSLAKVNEQGKASPTSCCKAPILSTASENGDVLYHCAGCNEQVTLVPELAHMSDDQKGMLATAKKHNAGAKETHVSPLEHNAAMFAEDTLEIIYDLAEEQLRASVENEILVMIPLIFSHIKKLKLKDYKSESITTLRIALCNDPKFWRVMIAPKLLLPLLEKLKVPGSEFLKELEKQFSLDSGREAMMEGLSCI